jgi:excinuclease UvrABC nuclease subunit
MADTIESLRERMEVAAAALDFEEARRLREMIGLIRGGAAADDTADVDLSGITRRAQWGSARTNNAWSLR